MNLRPLTRILLIASDLGMIALCFLLSPCILSLLEGSGPCLASLAPGDPLFKVALFCALLWLIFALPEGLYRLERQLFWSDVMAAVRALLKTGALLLVLLFLARIDLDFPRPAAGLAWLLALFSLPVLRGLLLERLLAKGGKALLVGHGTGLAEFCQARLSGRLRRRLGVIGALREDGDTAGELELPLPVFGSTESFADHVIREGVDTLVLCTAHLSRGRLQGLLKQMAGATPRLLLYPDVAVMELAELEVEHLGGRTVLCYNQNLHSPVNQAVKRAIDIAGALVGLLILAPLLLGVSLAIRLDSPGSPIYRHRRYGLGRKWIHMIKFRSMVTNGDEVLEKHLAENPAAREEWDALCKLKDDPRITKIGGFIRRWSIDELPQILNVLKGDMSLVGPRPINDVEYGKYGAWQKNFMSVRPGLTGLWQVSGRSDIDFEDRVKLDMYYIRNWTIWMDIRILFKTVAVVLKSEGAY